MKIQSKALRMAHILYADPHKIILGVSRVKVSSWQNCLSMGWYFVKFRQWLSDGVVTFTFMKKDGSLREARGTTHPLLIPSEDQPLSLGPESVTHLKSIPFYDIDKKAWRSFSITHFVGFITVYELKEKEAKRK